MMEVESSTRLVPDLQKIWAEKCVRRTGQWWTTHEKPLSYHLDPGFAARPFGVSFVCSNALVLFQVLKTETQEWDHEGDLLGEHSQALFILQFWLIGAWLKETGRSFGQAGTSQCSSYNSTLINTHFLIFTAAHRVGEKEENSKYPKYHIHSDENMNTGALKCH